MRWWTSDWHFNHINEKSNIIQLANRPFWSAEAEEAAPDIEAMNEALIDNFNDRVDPGDEAWLVGDAAMSDRKKSVPLFKRLRCRNLYLVPGNHDHVHKMYPKWMNFVALYEDAGFKIMDSQETVTIAGEEVLVCHFPYTGDSHGEDRYSGLRPTDEGQWLIHGHTHTPFVTTDEHPRQIHVGVDAWDFKPVPETEIEKIIAGE